MRKVHAYYGGEALLAASRRFADSAIAASQGNMTAAITLLLAAMTEVVERIDDPVVRASELADACRAINEYSNSKNVA
jgi:hypothetical protein